MFLLVHQPVFPVSSLASSITYYHSYSPAHEVERLLPDGQVDFIIDLTEAPKFIFDNESLLIKQACKKGWVSGARTSLISIDAGGVNSSMMVVRLSIGAAQTLFKMPLSELTDQVIDADLLLGSAFSDLRNTIMEAVKPKQKIAVMEDFLLKACGRDFQLPPVLQFAFAKLVNEPHQQAIQQLVQKAGYSHKHLISLFRKYAGITPKELMKVMRFQKVIFEIEKNAMVDWTRLALDCGYYDQAHFIKEFRQFSGFNPGQYLVHRGDLPNYIPVR